MNLGQGVHRVLHTVLRVHDAWSKRIHTWTLNLWLKDLLVSQAPTRHAGKTLTLKYITQIKSRPPTFALFCNVQTIPIFFERFLRKNLQHDFELQGIPLRFVIRKSKGHEIKKSLLQNKNKVIGVGDQGIGRKRARRGTSPHHIPSYIISRYLPHFDHSYQLYHPLHPSHTHLNPTPRCIIFHAMLCHARCWSWFLSYSRSQTQ